MDSYSVCDDLNKRINNIDVILLTNEQTIRNIDIENVDLEIKHNFSLPMFFYKPPYTTSLRRAKIILFDNSLSCYDSYKNFDIKSKINLLVSLEKTCYNYCISKADRENIMAHWDNELFISLYNSICYKISINISLDLIKNPQLTDDILTDRIDINNLPKLTSCDIDKKKYMKIIEKIEQGKSIVFTQKFSKMYRCRKCGESKCTTENKIKQSIDEGVGLLIRCVNCNNSWDG